MPKVRLSDRLYTQAMQSNPVRRALLKKAKSKQSVAEQIAASEDVDLESRVVEGTRPKGRPYARVQSANVGQEWGDRVVERKRILGRAAHS